MSHSREGTAVLVPVSSVTEAVAAITAGADLVDTDGDEALGEADGDSGVDGEGKANVCAEEGAGEWVEESGVDEGVVGADGKAGENEVDVFCAEAVDEAAEEVGVEGVGSGEGGGVATEEDDGAGVVLEGELGGGGVVAGGENPADVGAGAGVGDEIEGGKVG